MEKLTRWGGIAFAVFAIVDGIANCAQLEFLQQSMEELSLPYYMLYILGVAKISGGLTLLLPTPLRLREWACAGFSLWWIGGMAAHTFSNHAFLSYLPLLSVGVLLLLCHLDHHRRFITPAHPTH